MRRNTEITPQAVIVAVANDLLLLAYAESPNNPDNAEAAKTLFRLSNHWDWATRKAAAAMGVACEPKNERGLPLIGLSEKGQKLRNLYEAIDKGYPATIAPGGYGLSRGVVRKLRNAAKAVPLDDYNALAYLIVTAVLADRLKDLSQYVERLPQGQTVDRAWVEDRVPAKKEEPKNYPVDLGLLDTIRRTSWGNPDYHSAHEAIAEALIVWVKNWIKENPPSSEQSLHTYTEDQPDRGYDLAVDAMRENLPNEYKHILNSVAHTLSGQGEKLVKDILRGFRAKKVQGDRNAIEAKQPGYMESLRKLRKAKTDWNKAKKAQEKTEAFRRIGGIAKKGLPEGRVYLDLLAQVQRMERAVLGRVLTE